MSETERFAYRFLNAAMRLVLRSPLHGLFSKKVMLIAFAGRKSGKTYTVPLSYVREGRTITCFTGAEWSGWWKNLRGGAPVVARVRGRDLDGIAEAVADDGDAIAENMRTFLRRFPGTAERYGVTFGAEGRPDPQKIARAARSEKAVMIRIRVA